MKRVVVVVAAGFFAAAAVLLLSWTSYFEQLNSSAYDFTLRLAGPIQPSSPTLIVAIDEDSLGRLGAWPWSRDKFARLVTAVESGGPRAIGLDMILDESGNPEHDAVLAQAIGRAKSIVLAARIDPISERWRKPNPLFFQSNVRLGHVHADPDFGISRSVFSAKVAEGSVLPAFSLETLRASGSQIDPRFEQGVSGATVVRPQEFKIRFAGDSRTFTHIPAWQVLDGTAGPETFRDKIVLIGSTAEGVGDQWFTPFSGSGQRMAGVEIHANAIETLYAARWIDEVSEGVVFLALFGMIVLLYWLDLRFEGARFYVMSVLLVPIVVGLSWALMKFSNTWLPFLPFWSAIVATVPGLQVRKIAWLNRDMDDKIERLSRLVEAFEHGSRRRMSVRQRLLATPWRNAKWRLHALDFFNEELVRFVSFNQAILSSIEDAIIVSDIAGRVVYQNPAARSLEGYVVEPGGAAKYFATLLDGRDFLPAFEVCQEGKTVTMDFVPSGTGKLFNVTLAPISRVGLVLSLHDATAQHALNLAKNEMVSLVSHELRTPLTSIRGYSDMLVKYDLVEEKGKQFLATIIAESQRLNNLIQSFLDIAYIESGRQKITKTEFEIGPVLRDMLSVVEPVAAAKDIRIESEATDQFVRADRMLMYQALSNLVTNAIKYSPTGSTVRISVANGDGRMRFLVADQGCGIPAEEASKVFEKFYRRSNRETQEQSGFGLGLAFVKEVATRHGGEVTVDSEVGKGSTFVLSVPL